MRFQSIWEPLLLVLKWSKMNKKQTELAAELVAEYGKQMELTPGLRRVLDTLACVIAEENTLQNYVNRHGTVYEVTGKSGDVYHRARPQWQQLREARMRKHTIIAGLERMRAGTGEMDEVLELLQGLE